MGDYGRCWVYRFALSAGIIVRRGQVVRVLDDLSSGRLENFGPAAQSVQFTQGDVCDFSTVEKALRGADYVLHHAAFVSVPESVRRPLETFQVNVQGTFNVLEAARQTGVKRVLFACSSAIYGNGKDLPYKETSPVDCTSPYALSKQIGRMLCRQYTQLYGLDTVSLIYFNVFGPRQNPSSPYAAVIARFMQQAANGQALEIEWDGEQRRDFVHVQDVVQANLLAAVAAQPGESYNVARGESVSLLEMADLLDQLYGRKIPLVFRPKRPVDVKLSAADISKIGRLGFVPRVSLQEGLLEMKQLQSVPR